MSLLEGTQLSLKRAIERSFCQCMYDVIAVMEASNPKLILWTVVHKQNTYGPTLKDSATSFLIGFDALPLCYVSTEWLYSVHACWTRGGTELRPLFIDASVEDSRIWQLLGYFFNWALLGVLNVQAYIMHSNGSDLYHVNFTRDPLFLQCLVYGILVFEWVQTGLLTAGAFQAFVYRYGQTEALTAIYNGWFSLPIMCAMVSVVVQGFFAWRIYMLSKIRVLVGGIVTHLLAIPASFGVAALIGSGDLWHRNGSYGSLSSKPVLVFLIIWAAGMVIVDIVIAVTMTILMLKRKTGIRKTDILVNKVIRLVVETGTLTASVATVGIVLVVACPGTLYYVPVYSNTFVTNLLNRAFIRPTQHPSGSMTAEHISLALNPVHQETNPAHSSSSISGDRLAVNVMQKGITVLDKSSA
ncbi:hypothetical protein DAEQUDRAFT_737003 [Daedalea quercina L-15889]|uniref:DUF6534 domain-containing protein n=1 Tax=Daedalea quercina L-15889 TaxID=1314783 RepID=A0A165RVP4_9APHY|nr:hypothetical protein DAEQUDRAFT_737003 [Daedalea quercina L-15889]